MLEPTMPPPMITTSAEGFTSQQCRLPVTWAKDSMELDAATTADAGGGFSDLQLGSRFCVWNPHIGERRHFPQRRRENRARDFGLIVLESRGGRNGGVDLQPPQDAVDMRLASHALHNLLSQIAAFVKVDRVQLIRFRHQLPFGDLFAIAWTAVFDANHPRIPGSRFRKSERDIVPRRGEDKVSLRSSRVQARNQLRAFGNPGVRRQIRPRR